MTITESVSREAAAFVERATADAELAFRAYQETGTLTASGTVGFVERVPGEDALVSLNYPGPFAVDRTVRPIVVGFDGTVHEGPERGAFGALRFAKIFTEHDDITTVVHVHSPYLGAWSQSHRPLPIRYVPVQRYTFVRELPVYVDRRQDEADFILDVLRDDPNHFAILEANGGSTVWGRDGLAATAQTVLVLEEGAKLQLLAESLGGSQEYGPGVLEQQWRMGGLIAPGEQVAR